MSKTSCIPPIRTLGSTFSFIAETITKQPRVCFIEFKTSGEGEWITKEEGEASEEGEATEGSAIGERGEPELEPGKP